MTGADGIDYVCIANFSDEKITKSCPALNTSTGTRLAGNGTIDSQATAELTIPAGQVCVVRLKLY